jgi:hypothetical protein
MPSPARIVSKTFSHLERKGYTRPQARKIISDVIAAMGAEKNDWAPWQLDWLRKVWLAAQPQHHTASRPPVPNGAASDNRPA